MSKIIQLILKLVMLGCVVLGVALIVKTREEKAVARKKIETENNNPKALALKKYLLAYNKPERVEIFNYTKRYDKDVNEILDMKIATDPNSNFYITIQFFTDETDQKAPLVAQIRFLDIKSDNLVKEQSINLE